MLVLSMILVAFLLLIFVLHRNKKIKMKDLKIRKDYLEERILSYTTFSVQKHIHTLSIKRHQLIQVDNYGVEHTDKWDEEKHYFFHNVLFPGSECPFDCKEVCAIPSYSQMIDMMVKKYEAIKIPETDLPEDPVGYEIYCSDILKENGWDSRTTKGSGDQGVDIIAEKDGIKAVIQCKRYSAPVGNKAVQEIIAGRIFEMADIAAVVSTSSYTSSAQVLAQSAGVLLLHHSEITKIGQSQNQNKIMKQDREIVSLRPLTKEQYLTEDDVHEYMNLWFEYRGILIEEYYDMMFRNT